MAVDDAGNRLCLHPAHPEAGAAHGIAGINIKRDINLDRLLCALAAALCRFTGETGCRIGADGVESEAKIETLRSVGFEKAQGYFLGRPVPIDEAVAAMVAKFNATSQAS